MPGTVGFTSCNHLDREVSTDIPDMVRLDDGVGVLTGCDVFRRDTVWLCCSEPRQDEAMRRCRFLLLWLMVGVWF